jgi:DNA-binding transcriptional ArsR family regulator
MLGGMADDDRWGRRITDPKALRALAHPARLAILERLQLDGPGTATECAAVTDLSPSACSYHLRLLARYGFVEESDDPSGERSDGRERVWRATSRGWRSDLQAGDVDEQEAHDIDLALARVLLANSDDKVLAWTDGSAREPRAWRDATLISNSTILVTADELAGVGEALMGVLSPYLARNRAPDQAPEGARMVHTALRLTPRTARHDT